MIANIRILTIAVAFVALLILVQNVMVQKGPEIPPAGQPEGQPPSTPGETPPGETPTETPTTIPPTEEVVGSGTFRLLISDKEADIGDFDSLIVTLSKTRIFGGGGFEEFDLNNSLDLTQLIGENAISVLEVELSAGNYTKIELYADSIVGIVNGSEVDVKIPSENLKITQNFVIAPDTTTTFVFDINVVRKGQTEEYNLLPVIAKSGTGVDIIEKECTLDSDCENGEICVDGYCVEEEIPPEEPEEEPEEYFSNFYATCQVGDTSGYPPPEIYYQTELTYVDGKLIINDVYPPVGDLTLYLEPTGLHLFANTENGYLALDELVLYNLTVHANWTIDINATAIVPAEGNRTNITDDTLVFHTKNTSTVVQRDGHALGNVSCGPASGTSLVNQINKTLNGTLVHSGNESVINVLRNKMNTNAGTGTSVWGIVRGLARFLNQSGLLGNYSIKYFGNYTYANGTAWNGNTSVEGTGITWRNDDNITWIDYIRELFLTDEHVILRIVRTSDGQGHFVTGDDLRIRGDVATGEFHRFISFMDPWDGDIKEVELTGNCVTVWGDEWCIKDLISVSPVE